MNDKHDKQFSTAQRAHDNASPPEEAWFVCRMCGERSAESERAQDYGSHVCKKCDELDLENGQRECVKLMNP